MKKWSCVGVGSIYQTIGELVGHSQIGQHSLRATLWKNEPKCFFFLHHENYVEIHMQRFEL